MSDSLPYATLGLIRFGRYPGFLKPDVHIHQIKDGTLNYPDSILDGVTELIQKDVVCRLDLAFQGKIK